MKNDKRFLDVRFRAECDVKLSKGARWLLCRLINEKYLDRNFLFTSEFPLSHADVSRLTLVSQKQAYRYLNQLKSSLYLKWEGLRGCPATNYFRFVHFGEKEHREQIAAQRSDVKKVRAEKATKAMRRAVANAENPKPGQFTKGEARPVSRPKKTFTWDG